MLLFTRRKVFHPEFVRPMKGRWRAKRMAVTLNQHDTQLRYPF